MEKISEYSKAVWEHEQKVYEIEEKEAQDISDDDPVLSCNLDELRRADKMPS